MSASRPGEAVYNAAEWYGALASLKNKDIEKAVGVARRIAQSNSPYEHKADELLKALSD